MKILIVLIFLSINIYCQDSSINCDSLFYLYSQDIGVDKVPELIGGLDSLQSRLVYPTMAKENNIEGKVYILSIIDSTGEPICTKVIKGIGNGCDAEALRLIKTASFFPASVRSKPITCIIAIPIIFSLKNK